MNKNDTKRYNKIYAKIDLIAKEGSSGIMDYRMYVDEVVSNQQFYILQYVLERKYKINTLHMGIVDIKSEGVYNVIRFSTNSQTQDDIYKIYKEYNVYQLGADIYLNDSIIGTLDEKPTGLIVYHNEEVVMILDGQDTLVSKYRTAINYLTNHIQ